ncbi:MAG: hypothetical protein ACTSYB_14745 [Candidatus Helarchaeota archaeon]
MRIYNAELIDHYFINDGIDLENPTTWKVAVSVFKNPNNEYIISVCNYGSSTFTKTWVDSSSSRTVSITGLSPLDWVTILYDTPTDDLNLTVMPSATNIKSGESITINITVKDSSNTPRPNVRVEIIIGWETFIVTTDIQGKTTLIVTPASSGNLIVEVVALEDGFDLSRYTFALTVQASKIPGFAIWLCLFGLIFLIIEFASLKKNLG